MLKLLCLLVITACSLLAVKADGESRVIGGKNAVKGQFPHHAQIRHINSTRMRCMGSIIGDRYVLTTARPFLYGFNVSKDFRVIVGEVDWQADAIQHQVDKLIVHPGHFGIINDITVVRVAKPFRFSANVRAIRLPTVDTPVRNDGSAIPATIVGWGQYRVS